MSERDDRFRRLHGRATTRPETGDLFRHFGITLEAETEASAAFPVPIVAGPCRSCGWYLPRKHPPAACPLCAIADPLAAP